MGDDIALLFRATSNLTPEERLRYYREHDVSVEARAELESLAFFDRSDGGTLAGWVAETAEDLFDSESEDLAGRRFGPWEIVRALGRGGMGAVYLARRADGEVDQIVAIKLIRDWAVGAFFRDHFLRERRILARLSHPGIARLLDAGRSANGQPWLAMEYVEGIPVDEFADALALPDRLRLFRKVCAAVAWAHRSLVVHRDLKPSNILVDDHGEPHLLDFGIARILDDSAPALSAAAPLTRDRLLTPEYASPEQFAGHAHTTATDVYSLGAVLYKVLTGRPPHVAKAGGVAVETLVCSEDAVAPTRLNPALPRDLDFVVLKALRKTSDDRYQSVDDLADDIAAVLDSRPVAARAGSGWYRTRKFLRRRWIPVTASASVVAALAIGLLIAERERAVAQQRFSDLRHLAGSMLGFDNDIRQLPGSTAARRKLAGQALDYLDGLSRQTRGDRALELELATGYVELAEIQGVPVQSNLGQFAAAASTLRKADDLVALVLAHAPAHPEALLLKASVAQDAMILADSQRDTATALVRARGAVAALDRLRSSGKASDEQTRAMSRIYVNAALALQNQHLFDEAIRVDNVAIAVARSSGAPAEYIAQGLSILANMQRQTGDLDGALHNILEARQLADKAKFPTPTGRDFAMYGILLRNGEILADDQGPSLNRPAEAAAVFREALEIVDRQASQDSQDATSRDRVGTIAQRLGGVLTGRDPAQALAVYDQGIARQRELRDNAVARRLEARLLARSAAPLRKLGRDAESRKRIDLALNLLRQIGDYPLPAFLPGSAATDVLTARAAVEPPQAAAVTLRTLLAAFAAAGAKPEQDFSQAAVYSHVYGATAESLRRAGKPADASDIDSRRRALQRVWDGRMPGRALFDAHSPQASKESAGSQRRGESKAN